ncbi:glycosyltransferase family 2 protein [Clostridium intestinale]|uniref:Rhamnosyltransferase n=1 Tax=Clostridium intestinale DSM 6191 TaxID=1121320 RepID=A0A1M6DNC4_9CLOT|nr:glycosyltransferase family 2 protein [Clostridium intestinale]SHI74690.1 rhamnosyltransferase [Clostridium intestinale DSM 6191]
MKKVLSIIITYNTGKNILKSYNAIKSTEYDVLIVDNGSNEDTIKYLKQIENDKDTTIIYLNNNEGIASALNKGLKYAMHNKYDWALTLDHDSIVTSDMLQKMFHTYEKLDDFYKEKIAVITPVHIEEKIKDFKSIPTNPTEFTEVLTEITSGNLIKVSLLNKISLFKEEFFIDYVDHEFCLRINKFGYKVIRVNNAILLHNLGESEEKKIGKVVFVNTNHSPLRRYYMNRNRMWVWKNYKLLYPKWVKEDKIKFCRELIKIILFEEKKIIKIKMIFIGINHYYKNKYGKYNN